MIKQKRTEYFIKHILSSDWISVKYISDNTNTISFLSNDISNITFEKDDKVAYLVKNNGVESVFTTTVTDVDYLTLDKITISLQKPLERRQNSRFNVSLSSALVSKGETYKCFVVDLSKNGFRVISDRHLELSEKIDVTVFLTDTEYISARCKVIHKGLNLDAKSGFKNLYGLRIVDISGIDNDMYAYFMTTLE